MKMKISIWALLMFLGLGVFAQDEEGFTDEDLTKYATVMVWADLETQRMGDSVEYWVKNNEKLSASAYNELSKASKAGDISTAEATEEEVAVFSEIQQKIEDQKAGYKTNKNIWLS